MSAFETATKFFHACESLEGWEGCREAVSKRELFVFRDLDQAAAIMLDWRLFNGNKEVPGLVRLVVQRIPQCLGVPWYIFHFPSLNGPQDKRLCE